MVAKNLHGKSRKSFPYYIDVTYSDGSRTAMTTINDYKTLREAKAVARDIAEHGFKYFREHAAEHVYVLKKWYGVVENVK